MSDPIVDPWGERTPYPRGGDWPIRVDEYTDGAVDQWVQSACRALFARVRRSTSACGRAGSWACADARSTVSIMAVWARRAFTAGRRTTPPTGCFVRSCAAGGELREASWDEAMDLVAARSRELLDDGGGWFARLLHERAALPRGLLHAGARCAWRYRDEPSRRQHTALHGDGGPVAEGDVRLRRAARRSSTTSSTATRSFMSASTPPRRRRCCGCTSSIGCAAPTRRARS